MKAALALLISWVLLSPPMALGDDERPPIHKTTSTDTDARPPAVVTDKALAFGTLTTPKLSASEERFSEQLTNFCLNPMSLCDEALRGAQKSRNDRNHNVMAQFNGLKVTNPQGYQLSLFDYHYTYGQGTALDRYRNFYRATENQIVWPQRYAQIQKMKGEIEASIPYLFPGKGPKVEQARAKAINEIKQTQVMLISELLRAHPDQLNAVIVQCGARGDTGRAFHLGSAPPIIAFCPNALIEGTDEAQFPASGKLTFNLDKIAYAAKHEFGHSTDSSNFADPHARTVAHLKDLINADPSLSQPAKDRHLAILSSTNNREFTADVMIAASATRAIATVNAKQDNPRQNEETYAALREHLGAGTECIESPEADDGVHLSAQQSVEKVWGGYRPLQTELGCEARKLAAARKSASPRTPQATAH